MKRFLIAMMGLVLTAPAFAAGGEALPYHFEPDTANLASVQRGARNFMSYCSGCHSLEFLRYNRMAQDLGIPEDMLQSTLIFSNEAKPGDHMISAMPPAESAGWFGAKPPGLALETRARGPSWVYSYLMTFYLDDSRPAGVNNLVLPNASMPHVLWELQGWQKHKAAEAEAATAQGEGHESGPPLELAVAGQLEPEAYEAFVADTVNFLAYVAEPGKAKRISVGIKAMVYLLILMGLAYLLKKEFWKDIH